ncbi:GntR family transcriptional regulator OS=Lysinibacillus sphaericus OX=1421 GN=LS41612_21505 PE=3 SV=1 [Lysinibacillus sphaericus]
MELAISFIGNKPKYAQIYENIKHAILSKKLLAHEQLPSKRMLATTLHVSVHTIKEAYEQLLAEGYIYSKERSGYYIAQLEFEWLQPLQTEKSASLPMTEQSVTYDFSNGHVDKDTFPFSIFHKLMKQHFTINSLSTSPWQGEAALRQEIAKYVGRSRGIHCDPSQVFVYSGTQSQLQALCHYFGFTNACWLRGTWV